MCRAWKSMIFLLGASAAVAGRSEPVPEAYMIHRSPAVTVDGDLAEWDGFPYVVMGENTLTEKRLCCLSRWAWSPSGLYLALQVHQRPKETTGASVDLFVDTRPRSARLDRYEAGAAFVTIRPFPVGTEKPIVMIMAPTLGRLVQDAQIATKNTPDGWNLECFIPWRAFGTDSVPQQGEWISAAIRVNAVTGQFGERESIGAASVDRFNPIEQSPIAINPALLSGPPAGEEPIAYRAEEVVLQGDPWLDVEAEFPAKNVPVGKHRLVLQSPTVGPRRETPFTHSLGGQFLIARLRLPIEPAEAAAGRLSIRLSDPAAGWARDVVVATPVAKNIAEIDRSLPEKILAGAPSRGLSLAHLFKACAEETAAISTPLPDGKTPPQRLFRSALDPTIYDKKIAFYLALAKKFADGHDPGVKFPIYAWQSKIDGSWLPLIVLPPWNYDPARRYPAVLQVGGLNFSRSRTHFIDDTLMACEAGQYAIARGDAFKIFLYGRGNSYTREGDEEFDYIFSQLLPRLHVDSSKVSLFGDSAGASAALKIALRTPDRFAWLQLRSGDFSFLQQLPHQGLASEIIPNLSNEAVYHEAGSQDPDPGVPQSNRLLARYFQAGGIPSEYREWPQFAHIFNSSVAPEKIRRTIPDLPSHIHYATDSLNYNEAYWVQILGIEHWGSYAKVDATYDGNGRISVLTRNVARLGLHLERFDETRFPLVVTIDHFPPRHFVHRPAKAVDFELAPAGHDSAGLLQKQRGQCGPAARIESQKLTIVYGTLKPELTPFLKERAFDILSERIGTNPGQLASGHFEIMSDKQFDRNQPGNLWLIGGPSENEVTKRWLADPKNKAQLAADKAVNRNAAGPGLLTSYIYPRTDFPGSYIYSEQGTDAAAYLGKILATPKDDICVQVSGSAGTAIIWSGDFDGNWHLSDEIPRK